MPSKEIETLQAEIERHKANAEEWEKASLHWMAERDQLKARLDERTRLLNEFHEVTVGGFLDSDHVLRLRRELEAHLSKPAGSEQAPPLEIPSRTITLSGCEFTEDELLRRAVRAVRGKRRNTYPRWALVRDAFGCGSGVGTALCRRFGFDPEEILKS